jgi:hypothetical protein
MRGRLPAACSPLPACLTGFLSLLFLLASVAGAGDVIYRYVDDNGVANFAGTRDSIPIQYQSRVETLDAVTFKPVPAPGAASSAPSADAENQAPIGLSRLAKPQDQTNQTAAQPAPAEPAGPSLLDKFGGTTIPLPSQFQLGVGLTTLALIIGAIMVSRISRNPVFRLLLRSSIMLMLGGAVYVMYFSGLNEQISQTTREPAQRTTTGKELLGDMKEKIGKAAANNPVTNVIEKTKAATVGEANQAVSAANQANQQLDKNLRDIEASQ